MSDSVPLRTGPPTKAELIAYYPAKFTWTQLKAFVNSGDLGLLKRDKELQKRYDIWAEKICAKYGSSIDYLLTFRLHWGQPDTQSLIVSALDDPNVPRNYVDPLDDSVVPAPSRPLPPLPTEIYPPYFCLDTPPEFISIIQNDWPYSIPSNIEHTLIWTRIPIYHPSIIDCSIAERIEQDGLCGFTGNDSPPASPSTLHLHLPALADWGVTEDKLVRSERATHEQEVLIQKAGAAVHEFVKKRWVQDEWETAWFVNPPRLQSVRGLAHIHVFARRKNTFN